MNEYGIFCAAIEIDDQQLRRQYLDEACGADRALSRRVEALLEAHANSDRSLEHAVMSEICREIKAVLAAPQADACGEAETSAAQAPHRGCASAIDLDPEARKRFLREARAAAAVTHQNVVRIYSVEDQPCPYLVMEYVAGDTLQQRLDNSGPFTVEEINQWGLQIVQGLAASHAKGVIHRDVKPSNILLESLTNTVALSIDQPRSVVTATSASGLTRSSLSKRRWRTTSAAIVLVALAGLALAVNRGPWSDASAGGKRSFGPPAQSVFHLCSHATVTNATS